MKLSVGDKIYCKLGKEYIVTNTHGDDICILDDGGSNWWFGQIGETECWTSWFIPEKEWLRDKKLKELGI